MSKLDFNPIVIKKYHTSTIIMGRIYKTGKL